MLLRLIVVRWSCFVGYWRSPHVDWAARLLMVQRTWLSVWLRIETPSVRTRRRLDHPPDPDGATGAGLPFRPRRGLPLPPALPRSAVPAPLPLSSTGPAWTDAPSPSPAVR